MTIERNIDTLFAEEQDAIAAEKHYLADAEKLLETEFISVPPKLNHSRRNVLMAAGTAAAAMAASLLYFVLAPGELTATLKGTGRSLRTGAWISSANDNSMALAFSDGSEISMANNTEVRIQDLKTQGAHMALERGDIDVSIIHETKTRWDFDAGPFRILVTGTKFSANWNPEEKVFVLDMAEGSVAVRGPMLEDGKVLAKKDRLYVSLADNVVEIKKRDRVERIVATGDAENAATFSGVVSDENGDISDNNGRVTDRRSVRARSHGHRGQRERAISWRTLARKGRYAEAIAMVNQIGVSKIAASGSSDDLMLLGDAARLSNNTILAADIYKTVRRRFPRTAESQRAAFTLGRIYLEQRGNPVNAAKWFEICYRDNRQGTMAREAAGRLMEALDSSGNTAKARAAAQDYRNRYPSGPHSNLANKILSISGD